MYVDSSRSTTPRGLRVLLLVLAGMTVFQIGAVFRALQAAGDITENFTFPPLVQAGISIVWVVLFAWAVVGVWQRRVQAVNRGLILLVVFLFYSVVRLLVFTQADYDRQRLPFLLVLMVLLLIVLAVFRAMTTKKQAQMEN